MSITLFTVFFSLKRDVAIGIYEHCGITHLKRVTIICDTVSSVEMAAAAVGKIRQYVRTSSGADILSTERSCICLDKIIITIIIIGPKT